MSEKRQRTLWDRVQVETFGWAWVGTWLAAIWWEQFRWQLFGTGALCLALGMLIVNAVEFPRKRKPVSTPQPNVDEGDGK